MRFFCSSRVCIRRVLVAVEMQFMDVDAFKRVWRQRRASVRAYAE